MFGRTKLPVLSELAGLSLRNRLLENDNDEVIETEVHCKCCHKSSVSFLKEMIILILISSSLFGIFMIFLGLRTVPKAGMMKATEPIYSPGNQLVEYKLKRFYRSRGDDLSPYQGWPDDDKDRLWLEAYNPGLFSHIDAESAALLTSKTSRVAQPGLEDRYMVVLDVFHQLHCLNFVREAFYPERYGRSLYYPNGTLNYCIWRHIDHCIDHVRQSLMCSADVAPIPVQWNNETRSMRPRVDSMHTCKNYDKLKEWATRKKCERVSWICESY
ncbi:hypothetical protein EAF04_006280 [Stromatinia cepivora]|nr:hypothetical protein EAF04_006280 [Stromatinia cepivora]